MLEGIDVAILDLGLPDGNGADLIAELHAVSGDAVAVVFTSSVDPRQTENALQRGAAAALNKVDELDELLATVNRLRPRSNS
jgi:DNA-binding NarL/FixJ family response regulator